MNKQWYKESVFYHIYPLGFCGAPEYNDYTSEPVERLYKIYDWIPHLKTLGVNAIYLGPLFESSSHGYDTVDYFKVDRRLGTNKTLKDVIKTLHKNGIRVILDGVFNHVSRDFAGFKDLCKNEEASIYKDWFTDVNFNQTSPCGDNFSYKCWNGHFSLPNLNLKSEFVENHIINAITMWVEEFDIDGLRLDVAEVLDFNFLKELSSFASTIKKDFWLLGEVIHGDYTNWIKPEMLDSTTNYECYKGMYSSFNDANFHEIAYSLNRLFNEDSGMYKNMNLYNFVDNHDVNRISSTLKNPGHLFPLHILLFSIPGVPSIYYGSEWAIKGVKEGTSDSIVRPDLNIHSMYQDKNQDLNSVISRIANVWHKSEALKHGLYRELYVQARQFAFLRSYNGDNTIVVINSDDGAVNIDIPVYFKEKKCIDLLDNNKELIICNNILQLNIPGNWGKILKLI